MRLALVDFFPIKKQLAQFGHFVKFLDAALLSDLPPGASLSVEIDSTGRSVALFNVEGEVYALDNTCPHAGGPLGEGTLQGDIVRCPWHGWKFNVRTGQCLKNPIDAWAVSCFPLRVEKGMIQIALDSQDCPSEQHRRQDI